ncbi:MAG TPA: hypothetical protein VK081_10610, partial [Planctomycetota bacterium]|nr:hypothetical protein [Planctomycetota bacterium]
MYARTIFVTLALAAAILAVPALRRRLASDEAKVRWRIADAIADFNAGNTRAADVLAHGFIDETSGMSRDDLRAAIAFAAFHRRGPGGRFGYRLESDEPIVEVDGDTARANLRLRLLDARREPGALVWECAVEGELRRGDDGWQC